MEELFTGAFKALVELGGGGWIVSGLFLLGIVYLYRENGRIRDRAEAIGERTVIALERVGAINANLATTVDGSTKTREDMAKLLAEIARRVDSDGARTHSEVGDVLRTVRDLVEQGHLREKEIGRLFAEHKEIMDLVRENHKELVRFDNPRARSGG